MDTIKFYGVKKQWNIVNPPEDSDDDDMHQVHQQNYFQSNFIYIYIVVFLYNVLCKNYD